MRIPSRLPILTLTALVMASPAAPAVAGPYPPELVKKAKAHVEVAKNAYNLGQFDEALRAYEAAYRLVPRPSLLFNMGQCHRHAGDHDMAIFFYDGFLREGNPSGQQRAMVVKLRAESKQALDEAAAKKEAAAKAAELAATKAAKPVVEAPPSPPPPALVTAPPPEVVDDEPGLHEKWWFWVIVGVGVAAAGTGAALALSPSANPDLPAGTAGTVDWR